jgi:hypothetical protein
MQYIKTGNKRMRIFRSKKLSEGYETRNTIKDAHNVLSRPALACSSETRARNGCEHLK